MTLGTFAGSTVVNRVIFLELVTAVVTYIFV